MFRCSALCLLLSLMLAGPSLAITGATDRVPAASLLVPYFEVGTTDADPENTFLSVNNRAAGIARFHYHVFDIDGRPTALNGNIVLGAFGTWSASMRDLIAAASPAARIQLTNLGFYRGFMTIDLVTAATGLPPTNGSFPFANANRLEGYVYYAHPPLPVSGMSMVAIEAFPTVPDSDSAVGFYSHPLSNDNREDLGPFNRQCAARRAIGQGCGGIDFILSRIDMRVLVTPSPSKTRLVIFTWDPTHPGGPSVHCDASPGECDSSSFPYRRYNESGVLIDSRSVRLDHVVNIGDITSGAPGWVSVSNLPSVHVNTNFYAFSFNRAAPGWETLFEAFIDP